MLGFYC